MKYAKANRVLLLNYEDKTNWKKSKTQPL